MDNSLKGLILAAGVIITCIVVGLGFFISREAKNAANKGTNQISAMSSQFDNIEVTMYDGMSITGAEVVNVIRKHANANFTIKVTTKANSTPVSYSSKDSSLHPKGSASYINPSALFLGRLDTDANNDLIGISFSQQ